MKVMTRKERQMTQGDALKLLSQGEFGVLSTVDPEGQPYGIPLNYVLVDKTIYLLCAWEGYALDNIAGNNRVCFTVVGQTQLMPGAFTTAYESVVAFGQAVAVEETQKVDALKAFVKKYSPEHLERGCQVAEKFKAKTTVLRIDITHLTGKKKV